MLVYLRVFILICLFHFGSCSYEMIERQESDFGFTAVLNLLNEDVENYGTSLQQLSFTVYLDNAAYVRVKITDIADSRYEIPPVTIPRPPVGTKCKDRLYDFQVDESPFAFRVIRFEDQQNIYTFSSNFTFKDQYIQFSSLIDSTAVTFGLGESTRLNQHLISGNTYTLWARDEPAAKRDTNLYGSYPVYWQLKDGMAHGSMLFNSNGMDVELQDESIRYNVIGGVVDLYVFVGPTPQDLSKQYTSVVGRPALMPYWSLGFHNCKWGYTSIAEVEEVVEGYRAAGIPLDTQWVDIDYMEEYRDFTYDPAAFNESEVAKFVDDLHGKGMHFVPIIEPGIMVKEGYTAYDEGMKLDLFVKDLSGTPYLGQVWPGPVHFPDFLHPSTQAYWTNNLKEFYNAAPYDGLWIDMNEVSNFCNLNGKGQVCENIKGDECPRDHAQLLCCLKCSTVDDTNPLDFPPYDIRSGNEHVSFPVSYRTMAMSASQVVNVSVYDTHNLYGLMEQVATNNALVEIRQKRPFVLSRSSFMSTGVYSAKWQGDNSATWEDLKSSIVSLLDFSMFGVPMMGADICGFMDDSNEELCARWIEVGAFYTFSRDHSARGTAPQELYLWESVTAAAKNALGMRYQLIPYMYSLFYWAHTTGSLVSRSLWMNFYQDENTFLIDNQFMMGDAVLISPVLQQGAVSVDAYFPQGMWYDFSNWQFSYNVSSPNGMWTSIPTPLTSVNVHVYGGHILPLQQGAMTTTESRVTPFTLLVTLCPRGKAAGTLYWDDGENLLESDYLLTEYFAHVGEDGYGEVAGTVDVSTYAEAAERRIESIVVLWAPDKILNPVNVKLNGIPQQLSIDVIHAKGRVSFTDLNIKLSDNFLLSWTM